MNTISGPWPTISSLKRSRVTICESSAFAGCSNSAAINTPATFDAAKAKTAMDAVAASAKKLHGLYPAGSDKDPKTAADPKIWENKADFDKRLAEMGTLATAAGKTTTAETFKPAYVAVGATCKGCHDLYRKKKS